MRDSCLNCSHFLKCKYPNKRSDYKCNTWAAFGSRSNSIDFSVFEDNEDPTGDTTPSGFSFSKDKDYDKAELNLEKTLSEILDSNLPVPKDLKVDDRDIPMMPNFWSFCFDKTWGFTGIKPFSRQMWIATKLLSEYCPVCTPKDGKIMKDFHRIPVDFKSKDFPEVVQLLEHGVCPKCKGTRLEFLKKKLLKPYSELAVCAGQRSGKSLFTSFLVAYINHKYLKLQKPAEMYTDVSNATLTATFVSLNFQTAIEVLWTPIVDAIGDSKWYNEYHKLLAHANKTYGEELFKQMDTYISYKHRKLLLYPSVPNKRTLRGRTRYIYAIDELGWFDASASAEGKITVTANGVYQALDRSLLTARTAAYSLWKKGFYDLPTAFALNVSSPSDQQDKIMQLVTANRTSKTVLAVHAPTWEMNPKVPRNHPEIVNAYKVDPIGAERDYGANPPLTAAPFISNSDIVESAFTAVKNRVDYEYIHRKSKNEGKIFRSAKVKCYAMASQPASVMAVDAAYSDNSFAIAVGHREGKEVVFSALLEIIPKKGENVINHAATVRLCIEEMIKAFNVRYLVADRWNSIFLLHKLDEDYNKGIEQYDRDGKPKKGLALNLVTEQYSVTYDDFLLFRSYLEGGRIKFPKLELAPELIVTPHTDGYPNNFDYKPSSHLLLQMLTVQDAKRTVTKGTNRTDDLFRACVLASVFLLDEQIVLSVLNRRKKSNSSGLAAIVATSSFAGSQVTSSRGQGIAAVAGAGGGGGSTFARS